MEGREDEKRRDREQYLKYYLTPIPWAKSLSLHLFLFVSLHFVIFSTSMMVFNSREKTTEREREGRRQRKRGRESERNGGRNRESENIEDREEVSRRVIRQKGQNGRVRWEGAIIRKQLNNY